MKDEPKLLKEYTLFIPAPKLIQIKDIPSNREFVLVPNGFHRYLAGRTFGRDREISIRYKDSQQYDSVERWSQTTQLSLHKCWTLNGKVWEEKYNHFSIVPEQ